MFMSLLLYGWGWAQASLNPWNFYGPLVSFNLDLKGIFENSPFERASDIETNLFIIMGTDVLEEQSNVLLYNNFQ